MRTWQKLAVFVMLGAALAVRCGADNGEDADPMTDAVTQGALRVKTEGGIVECPLKHTDVQARISGFIARVTVTQTFQNPLDEKIEAVYVFPLPQRAAVDDMTMVIGDRRIVGVIKRRAAAREIYEQALARGQTAALLEQERPNIFTQSVGNIEPGQEVLIEISYVDALDYDLGTYTFRFPMVVGPRYIPGSPVSAIPPVPPELQGKVGALDREKIVEGEGAPQGTGWSPDTDRVPDASRITPPVLKPGYRTGHDISLSVALDAGVPVQDLRVTNHDAAINREGMSRAAVVLSPADSIPNKDFVLQYDVVGERPEMAVLTHREGVDRGYFLLMVQPREDERLAQSPPREICFLVDVSGSMSGAPTAKVKEVMSHFLTYCKPEDTLQVITFAGSAGKLFEQAVPATEENIETALSFTRGVRAGGGTEMLKGIRAAINDPLDEKRVRIVVLLTDGYIGNEAEIIAEVGRRCGDRIRFWCIGIGSSPNGFLIDGVARQGGGMSKVLGLNDDAATLAQEAMFRIHRAQLAEIVIDWGSLAVTETYPARIPELWAGRPVIVFGRYATGGQTTITLRGKVEGEPAAWPLSVEFPAVEPDNGVLGKVWARHKIEDLMHQTYYMGSPAIEQEVTEIALAYRLMSQYTSFVAVDETRLGEVEETVQPPRRMLVPVPIPEGTSYEGFFGGEMPFGDANGIVACCEAVAPSPAPARSFAFARGHRGAARRRGPAAPQAAPALVGRLFRRRGGAERKMAYLGSGVLPAGGAGRPVFAEADEVSVRADVSGVGGYLYQAWAEENEQLIEAAERAGEQADQFKKDGKADEARAVWAWACLLASAVGDGDRAEAFLEKLAETDEALVTAWEQAVPALALKLDIELRHATLAEALKTVGAAARVSVELLPGSVEDASALLERQDLSIAYLDLRRATLAQALDWILRPVRLSWWIDGGRVVAGSVRRGPGLSAWVYDVSRIAPPDGEDLNAIRDYRERVKKAGRDAEKFVKLLCGALNLPRERVSWYAPGRLVIFATADVHARAAALLRALSEKGSEVPADLKALHAETVRRAEARQPLYEKSVAELERARLVHTLRDAGWRVAAAAAGEEPDVEALCELTAAWRAPGTGALLAEGHPAAFRAAWAFVRAAREHPDEQGLAEIAAQAVARMGSSADAVLAGFQKERADAGKFVSALYAALSLGDESPFRQTAIPVLTDRRLGGGELGAWRRIAAALLQPGQEASTEGLLSLLAETGAINGEDMVALGALACRRAAGEPWRRMRAEAREILGRQPLSGAVVVLVNRLDAAAR